MEDQSILFLILSVPLYIAILILMLTYLRLHPAPIKHSGNNSQMPTPKFNFIFFSVNLIWFCNVIWSLPVKSYVQFLYWNKLSNLLTIWESIKLNLSHSPEINMAFQASSEEGIIKPFCLKLHMKRIFFFCAQKSEAVWVCVHWFRFGIDLGRQLCKIASMICDILTFMVFVIMNFSLILFWWFYLKLLKYTENF